MSRLRDTGLGRIEDLLVRAKPRPHSSSGMAVRAGPRKRPGCIAIVGRGVGWCGQARKGVWGMSWRQEAQGRGRLRKVPGSRQTGFDPETPEPTRGTETSQYPAEEKEKSTPSVAASERGRAQTGGVTLRGSRTAFKIPTFSGTAWNRRRHRVKAPYATRGGTERNPEYDSTRESESESAGTIPQG
jgi:hypothetical protein